jgi:hypothetical protein
VSADTVTQVNRQPELVTQSLQSGQIDASDVTASAIATDEIADGGSGDVVFNSPLDVATVSDGYLYAGGFSGSTVDDRLSNALSAATSGDVIYLEPDGDYTQDQTVNQTRVTVTGGLRSNFKATLTLAGLESRVTNIRPIVFSGGKIVVDAASCMVSFTQFAEIVVTSASEDTVLLGNVRADITDNGARTVITGNS